MTDTHVYVALLTVLLSSACSYEVSGDVSSAVIGIVRTELQPIPYNRASTSEFQEFFTRACELERWIDDCRCSAEVEWAYRFWLDYYVQKAHGNNQERQLLVEIPRPDFNEIEVLRR